MKGIVRVLYLELFASHPSPVSGHRTAGSHTGMLKDRERTWSVATAGFGKRRGTGVRQNHNLKENIGSL